MRTEKIKIKETVIVEGKYDKIKLKSVIDANIITTDGFRIFSNSEKQALIRNTAEKTGIIIMTDSDTAGRKIRNFIKNCAKSGGKSDKTESGDIKEEHGLNIINVYIPAVLGKEKRKAAASKENLIGVEGTDKEILLSALNRFGIKNNAELIMQNAEIKKVTKADFYGDKLTGCENSAARRKELCGLLNIPYMPSNSLLEAVNILLDYKEYKRLVNEIDCVL